MVKDVDGYLLTASIDRKYIAKVRTFCSAKTIDMKNFVKPTKRDFNPSLYIVHIQKQPSGGVPRKRCSEKYATNLQESTYAEVRFQ